jgi:hypothetical protein
MNAPGDGDLSSDTWQPPEIFEIRNSQFVIRKRFSAAVAGPDRDDFVDRRPPFASTAARNLFTIESTNIILTRH